MADEGFKRKLTAILSADAVEYSRLMGEDEEATVRTITAYREVLSTLIQQHNGKVLDSPGDNLLAEFASVVDAVQCAVAIQKELKNNNDELPENRRMQFRIGINLGDVIQEGDRIYGDGVNIAARLEGLAEPGGICISGIVFDQAEKKLPFEYDYTGAQTLRVKLTAGNRFKSDRILYLNPTSKSGHKLRTQFKPPRKNNDFSRKMDGQI